MNDAVFRPPRQSRVTLPNAMQQKPAGSLMQDPAIILIVALAISFVMLAIVTGWLLIQG